MRNYNHYMKFVNSNKVSKFIIGKNGIKFDYFTPGKRKHVSAYFKFNKNWYWGSVVESFDMLYGSTECMIFEAPGDGIKPISYIELYLKPNTPVTEKSLLACIREFCS